jgi:hypothetical protein
MSTTNKRYTTTTYKRVANNICKENNSYRVRFKKNGKLVSRNFATRKEAIAFRDKNIA